jgi:hypothetical protein
MACQFVQPVIHLRGTESHVLTSYHLVEMVQQYTQAAGIILSPFTHHRQRMGPLTTHLREQGYYSRTEPTTSHIARSPNEAFSAEKAILFSSPFYLL